MTEECEVCEDDLIKVTIESIVNLGNYYLVRRFYQFMSRQRLSLEVYILRICIWCEKFRCFTRKNIDQKNAEMHNCSKK